MIKYFYTLKLKNEFEKTRDCYKHIDLSFRNGKYIDPVIQKEWDSFSKLNCFPETNKKVLITFTKLYGVYRWYLWLMPKNYIRVKLLNLISGRVR